MFPLSPTLLMYIGVALLVAGLGAAVKGQTSRLDTVRQEYAEFRAEVRAMGEAAQKAADTQKAADKLKKERADAYNKKVVADLNTTVKRLRDERAGSDFLPPTPAGSRSPETAAFNRPLLERAIRDFDKGVQGLVDEGSKAVIDLNTAKDWVK